MDSLRRLLDQFFDRPYVVTQPAGHRWRVTLQRLMLPGEILPRDGGVKLGKRPGKWTAEVKALRESGMSVPDIARKFNRSRQAIHNVLSGKTAVYEKAGSTA
jgi:hypothetical protein